MQPVEIRYATLDDLEAIRALYHAVTIQGTGIARRTEEVTDQYVRSFIKKSIERGIILVAQEAVNGLLVAEIHTCRMEPMVFSHVLSDLTVVVHPAFQEHGIGRQLFETLLKEVELRHPQILRIELVAKESNERALRFYEQLGFVKEGRFERRIASDGGGYEADIPMAWFNPAFKG
ncbi:N-acetyltransferase [Paraflavitalea sp. CAU 1676]|uniref:GNAT family N-acetyltransferase n=1 Tax=Paraflavitalea sp. CAU 1676 TaxID=3032598 RepID=UPI0023DBB684|nr:N-acetyltransferase [Paraflavitalea sp. CAU 1676]MDF2187103.1 N-acetyltransferase [Paraflavitalea sp. CAU 1676]